MARALHTSRSPFAVIVPPDTEKNAPIWNFTAEMRSQDSSRRKHFYIPRAAQTRAPTSASAEQITILWSPPTKYRLFIIRDTTVWFSMQERWRKDCCRNSCDVTANWFWAVSPRGSPGNTKLSFKNLQTTLILGKVLIILCRREMQRNRLLFPKHTTSICKPSLLSKTLFGSRRNSSLFWELYPQNFNFVLAACRGSGNLYHEFVTRGLFLLAINLHMGDIQIGA